MLPAANCKNFSKKAYTLIEILIVMGLTLFLFSAAIQSFITTSSQFAFANTVEKVVGLIRQARSMALSAKTQTDYVDFNQNKDINDQVTPANYGVHLKSHLVTLFADNHQKRSPLSTDCKENIYDPGEGKGYESGCDIIIENFELPAEIKLVGLPEPSKKASVFYSPVFADVLFDPEPSAGAYSVVFGIEQKSGSVTRKRCFIIHKLAGSPEPVSCP